MSNCECVLLIHKWMPLVHKMDLCTNSFPAEAVSPKLSPNRVLFWSREVHSSRMKDGKFQEAGDHQTPQPFNLACVKP